MGLDFLVDLGLYEEFVLNLCDEDRDSLGDDYTACWMYAYYVHNNLGFDHDINGAIYENTVDILDFNLDKNGLYSCYIENDVEFHHFILIVQNDLLTLISTYGGQEGIIHKKFNKNNWLHELKNISENNYNKTFGIKNKIKGNLSIHQISYTYYNF